MIGFTARIWGKERAIVVIFEKQSTTGWLRVTEMHSIKQ